ncbi:alkanesulfonate monooxygenase [bacterium SCGC AG-212-C10]|nr:alkanesulfonate monooxygenase [bacterium SCGC AG-212-C10]
MAVEFIGMIGVRPDNQSGASVHVIGGGVDPAFLRDFTRVHEDAGFDKVLVGYSSSSAEGFTVAGYAASQTERIGFLVAHRPGFLAPTLAARKAATFDNFYDGRLALHIITGGSDDEQRRDGDFLTHDERYRRTGEYLDVMRRVWTEPKPFDFAGEFYQFTRAYSDVKPLQQPHVPLYFGGQSDAAVPVAAQYADCFALWGEPLAAVREKIAEVRAAAAVYGRTPSFSVSMRPILAPTEGEAWDKAHAIHAEILKSTRPNPMGTAARPEAVGSQRLLQFADQAEVHDERLYMAIAQATGAPGNTTALVGTPEQVAKSLLAYYDLGVRTLLIRGFDPLNDAREYGRELIPLVRAGVAERDAAAARQAVPA